MWAFQRCHRNVSYKFYFCLHGKEPKPLALKKVCKEWGKNVHSYQECKSESLTIKYMQPIDKKIESTQTDGSAVEAIKMEMEELIEITLTHKNYIYTNRNSMETCNRTTAIFTDALPVLQALKHSCKEQKKLNDALTELKMQTDVQLQWMPVH